MFFLIRSAVCIGTVAVLATGGGQAGMRRVIDSDGRQVVRDLGRACLASNGCLRFGLGVVAATATVGRGRAAVPVERSADTLTASDLSPAWIAPAGRRAVASWRLHPGTLARL